MIVRLSGIGIADHRDDRGRDLLVRQVGQLEPRPLSIVEPQRRLSVQPFGEIARTESSLGLHRMMPFAALVLPRADFAVRPFLDRCRVRRVEPHLQPVLQAARQQGLTRIENERAAVVQIIRGAARDLPGAPRVLCRIPHRQVAGQGRDRRSLQAARAERNAPLARPRVRPDSAVVCHALGQAPNQRSRCARLIRRAEAPVRPAVQTQNRPGRCRVRVLKSDLNAVRRTPPMASCSQGLGIADRNPHRHVECHGVAADPRPHGVLFHNRAFEGLLQLDCTARPLPQIAVDNQRRGETCSPEERPVRDRFPKFVCKQSAGTVRRFRQDHTARSQPRPARRHADLRPVGGPGFIQADAVERANRAGQG